MMMLLYYTAAAAVAVIEQIEEHDLLAEGRRIEATLRPALEDLQREFPVIGDIRGIGAMIAIELVQPGTKEPYPAAVATVSAYAGQHGVLLLTAGTWGNVLRFLPSLAITDEQLLDAVSVIREALATLP